MKDERLEKSNAALRDASRRAYLQLLGILGLGSGLAASVVVPALEAFAFPLRASAENVSGKFVKVGRLTRLQTNSPLKLDVTSERVDAWNRFSETKIGSVWVVRRPNRLAVFSSVCPHLGCAVDFDAASEKFKCPCHASVFSLDGEVLAGPAPRALDELDARVEADDLFVRYERFQVGIREKRVV